MSSINIDRCAHINNVKAKVVCVATLSSCLLWASTVYAQSVRSLPRAAASGAYSSQIQSNSPISSEIQRQLYAPPQVEEDVNAGFYPALTIDATQHDNALKTADQEQDDLDISIFPSLLWRADLDRHSFEAGLSAGFKRWDEFDELDEDYILLSAALGLDITERFRGDFYAGHLEAEEGRGASGSRTVIMGEQDEFEEDTIGGRLTLGRTSNILQLMLGVERIGLDFTNNNQGERDRDFDNLFGGIFFNVMPRTSLFLDASSGDVDYTNPAVIRDNDLTTLGLGVGWDITDITSLLLRVGKTEKDFDNVTLEDFDGTTYTGRLAWQPEVHTDISFYTTRVVQDSTEFSSSFFTSDLIGLSANKRLTDRWGIQGHYNRIDDEFSQGRDDKYKDWGIGVTYGLNSYMSLGAHYGLVERRSNVPDADYRDKEIGISVTLRTRLGNGR